MPDHIAAFVEASLYVSLATYIALAVAALTTRDGSAWKAWQWSIVCAIVGTIGAVSTVRGVEGQSVSMIVGGGFAIAIGRLGGAFTNLLLAIHLKRLVTPAPPKTARPRRRRPTSSGRRR